LVEQVVPESKRDSKAALLAAASSEFATYGYSGARVDRIARQASVNKQLIFYYFKSKEGLYQAVLEQLVGDARSSVTSATIPPGHADARLRTAVALLIDTLSSRPHLVELSTRRARRPIEAHAADSTLETLRDPIRRVVLEGQGVGFFRDDVHPAFVAELAVSATLGHIASETETHGDERARRAWRDGLADLLIRALAW
jgi:AcrR family transcriptional regulator